MNDSTLPSRDNRLLERQAQRRARAKLGWFTHAAVYAIVNLGLIAVSVASGKHWAVYPLLGWGLGLFLHGLSVWVFAPGNTLMERLVEREHAQLRAAAPGPR